MKVVFILNNVQGQRCIKRIEEFIDNGFEIEAYGFFRNDYIIPVQGNIDIVRIAEFSNASNYFKRALIMWKSLKKILSTGNKENIYYFFNLDVAIVANLIRKTKYIYEEGDLRYLNFKSKIIKYLFKRIDIFIIKKSVETVFTSEGFANYLFGNTCPQNISIIPNKLNKKTLNLPIVAKEKHNFPLKLKIGFVGTIRYHSIYNFVSVFAENFSNYEFHFYGGVMNSNEKLFYQLKKYDNVFFHGTFVSPDDLPMIYSKIDMVLSAYDVGADNVKYAEPNKLYEAIFFGTPIIVSKGTFLSEKVKKMDVGYSIDPFNNSEIVDFFTNLTLEDLNRKIAACVAIDKKDSINSNTQFFHKLKNKGVC